MSWPNVKLAQCIESATSGFASGDVDPQGVAQLRMNNVGLDGSLRFEKIRRIPREDSKVSRFCLEEGDVLFNATNSPSLVGKTALIRALPEPFVFSNHFIRIRVIEDKLDAGFLAKWLTAQQQVGRFELMCNKWVNQASVRREDLLKLKVPLPPLAEQRRIAAILDKADALRAKRREAIAKLDQLLQSVFLDMFGDPKTNPRGFPVHELSKFYISPGDGTRCGPFGSALKKSDITDSGIPLWNMDNISSNGEMQMPFRAWVSKGKAQELDAYRVADGDILISRAGTVGKMCVARTRLEESLITTNLIRLRLGHQLIPEFFVALMTYCKGRVGRLRTGPDGAFTHMSTGVLDKLSFPYPPVSQQRSWVARSVVIQEHKAKLNEQLELMTRQLASISAQVFSEAG